MESMCRVCMSSCVTLVEIFSKQSQACEEPSLVDMLTECVDCEVKEDDPLPNQICLTCVIDAKNAFRFKRKCEQSYKTLWKMLNEERAEEKEEDYQTPDLCIVKIEEPEIPDEEEPKGKSIKSFGSIISIKSPVKSVGKTAVKCDNVKTLLSETTSDVACQIMDKSALRCPHCPKLFNLRLSLQRHMWVHGRNPFKCPDCCASFAQRQQMEEHTSQVHSDARPYKCSNCEKSFSTSTNLELHLRVHSRSVRVFQCPHCPKTFERKSDVKYHILVHTGERPHKCLECSKAFKKKQHLEYHMFTHRGGI